MAIIKRSVGYTEPSFESFTPTWKGDSGDPAIGNGTLEGYKKYIGDVLHINIFIKSGSTTTWGTGNWYFVLPDSKIFAWDRSVAQERNIVGACYVDNVGASLITGAAVIDVAANAAHVRLVRHYNATNFFASNNPMAWDASLGDLLTIQMAVPVTDAP